MACWIHILLCLCMNLLYFTKGVKCGFHVIIVGPPYECVYMVTLGESVAVVAVG